MTEETTDAPVVYMTTDISAQGLLDICHALDFTIPDRDVASKISIGENSGNYLQPDLIAGLVKRMEA